MNTRSDGFLRQVLRHWVGWLAGVALLVMVLAIIAWASSGWYLESRLVKELDQMELGKARVGQVKVNRDGMTAREIEFFRNEKDAEPWLSVDRLDIRHPISELISGVDQFEEIELDSVAATIDLSEAREEEVDRKFDLRQFKLPARKVDLTNSQIRIRQSNRPDLEINDVDVNLQATETGAAISGSIGEALGGTWQLEGDLEPNTNQASLNASTELVELKNGQWQSFPYLPKRMSEYVQGSGRGKLSLDLNWSSSGFSLDGQGQLQDFSAMFPELRKLALVINDADIRFNQDVVEVRNIRASTDDGGALSGNADIGIASFPIVTEFDVSFQNVEMETWRKLVWYLPEMLAGTTSGEVDGTVSVEQSTRTTIALAGKAKSNDARYGSIAADQMSSNFDVEQLVFDAQQRFDSVTGDVAVDSSVGPQPVEHVLDTFDLAELDQLLDLDGRGDGRVTMNLPLESFRDLRTWQLDVNAKVDSGSIGDQPIREAVVVARMDRGFLKFDPISATPVNEQAPADSTGGVLNVTLAWPLADDLPPISDLKIATQSAPAPWVIGFFESLIQNSQFDPDANTRRYLAQRDDVGGRVDMQIEIQLPANRPEKLPEWTGTGIIRNSSVSVGEHVLADIAANLDLRNGELQILDASGKFDEDRGLKAQGRFDLVDNDSFEIGVTSPAAPLKWLVGVARQIEPDLANQSGTSAIVKPVDQVTLDGELAIELDLRRQESDDPWSLELEASSQRLEVDGIQWRDVVAKGSGDADQFELQRLTAKLDDEGSLDVNGILDRTQNRVTGEARWSEVPLRWWTRVFDIPEPRTLSGTTTGNLTIRSDEKLSNQPDYWNIAANGTVNIADFGWGSLKFKTIGFDVTTDNEQVKLVDFRTAMEKLNLEVAAQLDLHRPYEFKVSSRLENVDLSDIVRQPSVIERPGETIEIDGKAFGDFQVAGRLEPLDWQTSGQLLIRSVRFDGDQLDDIRVTWMHLGNDWKKSRLEVNAFDGQVRMVELTSQPERIAVEIKNIKAIQLSGLLDLPADLTGRLNGRASLNDWSLEETRWADLELEGSSLLIGPADLGEFRAEAEYRNRLFDYQIQGRMLGGQISGVGNTPLDSSGIYMTEFPLKLTMTNASLRGLYGESNYFRTVRDLDGRLAATIDLVFGIHRPTTGVGKLQVDDLKWKQNRLTRTGSMRILLKDGQLILDNVKADLERGMISARAAFPVDPYGPGAYEMEVRRLDLERISEILWNNKIQLSGLVDGRVGGRIGQRITGTGTIGLEQAAIHGLSGQSMKLPVQFTLFPLEQSGRFELRRSRFRVFDGNASGTVQVDFGRRLNITTDLEFSNVDSGKLLSSVLDYSEFNQGKLNGRLIVKGNGITSPRDLTGSFQGKLERTAAFQLPVLEDIGRFLAAGRIQTRDYNSDQIQLRLNNGRVQVERLHLYNSLVKVAMTGNVFLDGRLDLNVIARVEQLNTPTLLDEFAGSPLVRLSGTPGAFFAQAAEFLSERVVFLHVRGTIERPVIRIDTSQQLREETIRYFLRGRQILPYER